MQFKVLTLFLFAAIVKPGFAQQAQSGPKLIGGQAVVETQMGGSATVKDAPAPYTNKNTPTAKRSARPGRHFKKEPQRNFSYDQIDRRPEPSVTPMPVAAQPMTMADFQMLKQSVEKQSFADVKMQLIKMGLTTNWFTTEQIRELMKLFSFESSKIELAKAAYERTVDKNRYYALNNEFTFSSSVEELTKFLNAQSK